MNISKLNELSPSYLSRFLLWEERNLSDAVKKFEQRFGVTVNM